jgi:hypothetical protein
VNLVILAILIAGEAESLGMGKRQPDHRGSAVNDSVHQRVRVDELNQGITGGPIAVFD